MESSEHVGLLALELALVELHLDKSVCGNLPHSNVLFAFVKSMLGFA